MVLGSNRFFSAVAEGRGHSKGMFGVAVMHFRSLQVELCQFVDSAEFTRLKARIQVADPQEVFCFPYFIQWANFQPFESTISLMKQDGVFE